MTVLNPSKPSDRIDGPTINEGAKQSQPPGLFLLFIVEMWERFSYYGMRALLVLYLVTKTTGMDGQPPGFNPGRGWSKPDATNLYGWYTGLAYLVPIIGGLIADKLIGTHRSMLVGGLIIALGHITLAASGIGELARNDVGMAVFVCGLALIVLGTGHFKPCVSVMVGQLYGPSDPRRDGGFSIFYMGINLGAFICAFVCGTLGEKVGWHWGFGSAAVGMILGLIIYTIGRPRLLQGIGLPPQGKPNVAPLFFLISLGLAATFAVLYHTGVLHSVQNGSNRFFENKLALTALAAVVLAGVAAFVASQRPDDKGPVLSIFVFMVFNVVFWVAFEQAGSSLNLFAQENTNRMIGKWEMPTTWFQSVNPLLIIALAPLFGIMWSTLGKRNRNPSQAMKIAMGLFLLSFGYVFMVMGGKFAASGVRVSMFWLMATYFFHTLGELCLSPTGLSYVTKAAPIRFVSLLMGIWFLSNFLANKLGGTLAGLTEGIEQGKIDLFWYRWFRLGGQADFYLLFVIAAGGAGILMLVLVPLMKRLARE